MEPGLAAIRYPAEAVPRRSMVQERLARLRAQREAAEAVAAEAVNMPHVFRGPVRSKPKPGRRR